MDSASKAQNVAAMDSGEPPLQVVKPPSAASSVIISEAKEFPVSSAKPSQSSVTTAPTQTSTKTTSSALATPLNIPKPTLSLLGSKVPEVSSTVTAATTPASTPSAVGDEQPVNLAKVMQEPVSKAIGGSTIITSATTNQNLTQVSSDSSALIQPSPIRVPNLHSRPSVTTAVKHLTLSTGASAKSTIASITSASHRLPTAITPVGPLVRTPLIAKQQTTNNPVSLTVVQQQQTIATDLSKPSGALAATGVSNIRQITAGASGTTFPVTIRAATSVGHRRFQTNQPTVSNIIKPSSTIQLFPSSSSGVQIRGASPIVRAQSVGVSGITSSGTVPGGASITLKTSNIQGTSNTATGLRSPDTGSVRVSIIPSNSGSATFGNVKTSGIGVSTTAVYKPITITTQPSSQTGSNIALQSPGIRHISPQPVRIGIPTVSGATTGTGHQIIATTASGAPQRMTIVSGQTVTLNPVPIGASPSQQVTNQVQTFVSQPNQAARILNQQVATSTSVTGQRLISLPAVPVSSSSGGGIHPNLMSSVSIQKAGKSLPFSQAGAVAVTMPNITSAVTIPKQIVSHQGSPITATLTSSQLDANQPGAIPIARVVPHHSPLVTIASGIQRDSTNLYITNTPLQIATSGGAIVLSTTTGNINNQSLPQVTQRAILGVPGGVKLASISQNQPLPTAGGHNNKPIDDAVVADERPGILRKRETETQQNDVPTFNRRNVTSSQSGLTAIAVQSTRPTFQQPFLTAVVSTPSDIPTSVASLQQKAQRDGGASSGSSTLSATSSPCEAAQNDEVSGDDLQAGSSAATERKRLMENQGRFRNDNLSAVVGVSPRKKPRKQHLTPQKDPSTSTNFTHDLTDEKRKDSSKNLMNWNLSGRQHQSGSGGAIPLEDSRNYISKPQMSLLHSYRHTWKSRHNHFLKYSDVKPKDERKQTVNEIASEKYIMQKINGWKLYHVCAQLEDVDDTEVELMSTLKNLQERLEAASSSRDLNKDLHKVFEAIKANLQRSKIIQENVTDTKKQTKKLFEHKNQVAGILDKYSNKRCRKAPKQKSEVEYS